MNDLTKSGLAFAVGTSLVGALVGFRTQGDVQAIVLTLSIPTLFYCMFGFYQIQMKRKHRLKLEMQSTQHMTMPKISRERLEIIFGQSLNDNPLATLPVPRGAERRVLIPREQDLSKQRILYGRSAGLLEDEADASDQWYS